MGNLTINNGGIITNSTNLPNVDLRYGPYNSLDQAYGSLAQSLVPGLVIGVIGDDGKITDYQAQRGGGNIELVPRSVIISYEDLDDIPEITDGTNNAELKGTIEVSATSGNVAGVNIDINTPGTIGLEFTLPKGMDGQNGAPGHNPCLGRFAVVPNPMPTGQVGDYLYVDTTTTDPTTQEETTTTTVYHYGSNGWDNGTAINSDNPTFASSQEVTSVAIKDIDGNNDPNATAVLSADAGEFIAEQIIKTTEKAVTGTLGKLSTSGVFSSNNSYRASSFHLVKEGDKILYKGYANANTGAICGYSNNTEDSFVRMLLQGSTSGGNPVYFDREITVPNGINYIRICWATGPASDPTTDVKLVNYTYIKDRVEALESEVNEVGDEVDNLPQFDVTENISFNGGNYRILKSDGTIDSNTNYICTELIEVKEGWVLVYNATINTNLNCGVAGYSNNLGGGYTDLSYVGSYSSYTYTNKKITIPAGINYIRVCALSQSTYSLTITKKIFDVYDKRFEIIENNTINKFKGKVIAVIGDSISSGTGLNPYWTVRGVDVGQEIQAWVSFYDVYNTISNPTLVNKSIGGVAITASMIGTLQTFTPIADDVGKVIGKPVSYYGDSNGWAYKLCDKLSATLINASWSGTGIASNVSKVAEGVNTLSIAYGWHPCTIGRCKRRDANGNVINPDIVIIKLGENDFNNVYLDDYDINNSYPTDDSYEVSNTTRYSYERAYYLTIKAIRDAYPNAFIFCSTLYYGHNSEFPSVSGKGYSWLDLNKKIREIANKMGCGIINFDKCGITYENRGTYMLSIPHPNSNGQTLLANRALVDMNYCIMTNV